MSDDLYQGVLNKILGFLSYRSRTRKELEQRIDRYLRSYKGLDIQELEATKCRVLDYLDQNKLIDDEGFAKLYIESKGRGKSILGKQAILYKLMQKGISKSDAKDYLDEALSVQDELIVAQKALHRKYKVSPLTIDGPPGKSDCRDFEIRKARDSMAKYLVGRGFSYDIARQAVDYLLKRP